MDAEIVLREDRGVPGVGVSDDRRILRQRTGKSDFEIRQSILADHSIEGEGAVIVQQRLLNVFIERKLATKLKRVTAVVVAEGIAGRIEICSRYRAGNGLSQIEEPGHTNLWQ